MLSRWVFCILLVLLLVGEVDEFCHSAHGHRLGCYRPGAVVDQEQCPLNLTGCLNAHGDVNDRSALTIDTSGDRLCECRSDNSSGSLCGGCGPSSKAVTMAADDLSTTIYTLHLYIYYVWAYLKLRAGFVPHHVLDAADTATYKVAMRLNETITDRVKKLWIREVLNALSNICSKTLPLGSVCGNLNNNQITNKRKRQREISDALQHLKGLLEAYSCVTREISDSDSLCCYISCCEVVPRIKQCLNVLNITALHSIGEDVALIAARNALRGIGGRGMEDMNFLQWIGRGVGATFDCVHH